MVWVVLGGQVHRCSAHAARPLTQQETVFHEITHGREELEWKSLQDILPWRDYVDMVDDAPQEDDVKGGDLPPAPDHSTWMSAVRVRGKKGPYGYNSSDPPVIP